MERALKKGMGEARIDGKFTRLTAGMALSRYHEHTIEVVTGRLPAKDLEALIARSLEEGGGHISIVDGRGREEVFSVHGICPACRIGLDPLDPRLFSFNSKQGACPACHGLGVAGGDDRRGGAARSPGLPRPAAAAGSSRRRWRSRSAACPSGTWSRNPAPRWRGG